VDARDGLLGRRTELHDLVEAHSPAPCS
jgi:hypothetical protein